MKVKNKLFFIALILSLMFSISVISAQENMTFDQSNEVGVSIETDSDSNVLKLEEQKDTQTISNENTDSSTLTASNRNFTDIQRVIDATPDGATVYLNGEIYEGSTELKINKTLTIYGGSQFNPNSGATLISHGTRIMNITADNVIIHGITFINGKGDDGGAIYLEGNNCIIENCNFENNTATNGGAIFANGTYINITFCEFLNNEANRDGGAIYADVFNLRMTNTTFSRNKAHNGGALYGIGDEWHIEDFLATDNHATTYGGTIFIDGFDNYFAHMIIDSTSAEGRGGAIYLKGDNNEIFDAKIANASSQYGEGGAIYVNGNNFILSESIFDDNYAFYGGAIWWEGEYGLINSSNFISNGAESGGAIFWVVDHATIENIHFYNNVAGWTGGAICSYRGHDDLSNCLFESNSAVYGGACYFEYGYTDITECSFIDNNASECGGAIAGGAHSEIISNTTFERNIAKIGGALWVSTSNGGLDNCKFIENTATSTGGALYWIGTGDINRTEFTKNSAKYGGAIHMLSDKASADSNTFINNSAKYSGTSFMVEGADDSITNNYIDDNSNLPSVYVIGDRLKFENNTVVGVGLCYPYFIIDIPENSLILINQNSYVPIRVHDNFNNPMEGEVAISDDSWGYSRWKVVLEEGIGYFKDFSSSNPLVGKRFATYKTASATFNITVVGITQPNPGEDTLKVDVYFNTYGNFTLTINDKEYYADIFNNCAMFHINDLPNGTYMGELKYSGDEKYASASTEIEVVLKNSDVELFIASPDSIVGHAGKAIEVPVHIYTSLSENSVGNVTLTIKGLNYQNTLILIDGTEIFNIPMPKTVSEHDYEIEIKYMHYTKTIDLEIVDQENPIKKITQNDDLITVDLPGDAKGNVVININNHEFNASVIGGDAIVKITGLPNGTYAATVIYSGDDIYPTAQKSFNVTVKDSNITANIIVADELIGHIGKTLEIPVYIYNDLGDPLGGQVTAYCAAEGFTGVLTLYNGEVVFDMVLPNNPTTMEMTITYMNYNKTVLIKVFDPAKPILNISQKNNTVTVTLPDDATGKVILTIMNKNYDADVIKGTAVIRIDDLPNGTYDGKISYDGDSVYSSDSENITVVIKNSNIGIVIEADNQMGNVGENIFIPISVHTSTGEILTGDVAAYATGISFHVIESLINGNVILDIPLPNAPTVFDLTIKYQEFEKTIQIRVIDITQKEGGNGTVIIDVGGNGTGNVTVTIGDKNYTGEVNNGTATINITDLPNGTYGAIINYTDENGTSTVQNTTVEIKDSEVTIIIEAVDEIIGHTGKTLQIPVLIKTSLGEILKGEVTAYGVGYDYEDTKELSNGVAVFKIPMPDYSISFQLLIVYKGVHKSVNIKVADTQKPIEDITEGENNTVIVNVPEDATGNVTVTIGDKNYTGEIVNGTAVINITDLPNGTYEGKITYPGDDNYNKTEENITVVVKDSQVTTIMEIPENLIAHAGETLEIPVLITSSLGDKLTGNVSAQGVGYDFNDIKHLSDGKAVFKIQMPDYSTDFQLIITYNGIQKTVNVKVGDPQKPIEDVTQNENDSLIINLPGDATGNVTVIIGDKNYTGEVKNGTAVVNITDLPNGTYEGKVIYSGDDTYDGTEENITVVIKNSDVTVIMEIPEELIGHTGQTLQIPVLVYTSLGDMLTGKVSAYGVAFNWEASESLDNGLAVFKIPMPDYATTLSIMFFYGDIHKTVTVKVTDSQKPIDDVTQGENNTVIVNLPEDATGNVTVTIGDKNYTGEIVNGTAVVNITDLPNGTYDGKITYSGDDNYNGSEENITVVIENSNMVFIIDAADKLIGHITENLLIPVHLYNNLDENLTGNVEAYCSAIGYTDIQILNDGRAIFTIPMPANPTDLELTIRYMNTTKTVLIKVTDPNNPIENITQPDDNGSITITLPEDENGNITVTIGDKNYTAEVINGTAVVNITDLPNGTYNATINYTRDDGSSVVKNTTVEVKNSNVSIIMEITAEITGHINQTLQIPVLIYTSTGDWLTGEVTAYGVGYEWEGSAQLNNGVCVFKIPMPNYQTTFSIMFFYDKLHKTVKVTVADTQKPIEDITQPDNGTDEVVVTLPDDATGNVTVVIDGKNYTAEVINGTAAININDLPNGTYNATVIYPGDGNYSNMTKIINVIVKNSDVKPSTPVYALTGSNINVLYTGNAAYKVLVTKDGKAVGAGENVVINFNGADTIVKTDANGYAVLKLNTDIKVGTYDVKVTYNGVTTTNKVTINHLIKAPNKKVKKSRKVTKIKITLKKVDGKFLKGKKLTIKLKGKKYTVKTNKKGVAKWKVKKSMLKKFKVGKKIKYTVTYGKDTLTKKLTIKK